MNALQRHATVVVQKSLAEGFGLTVAEAMWKARPVVGAAVETLLRDRNLAETLGPNAQQRAGAQFLGNRHLEQYGRLFARLG